MQKMHLARQYYDKFADKWVIMLYIMRNQQ